MPRTAASNGVKPYLRALAVIKPGVPVTPQAINDHVGTGDYAAKYISFAPVTVSSLRFRKMVAPSSLIL